MTNLLLYRFLIFNALVFAGMVWLHDQGHVRPILDGDRTFIVFGIIALFVTATLATAFHVARTALRLNEQKRDGRVFGRPGEREKADVKLEWIAETGERLVGLGLIGTVIGFSIALSGIDPGSLVEASGVQQSIETLIAGMRVALNTTIVGSVLGLWHGVNWRILETGHQIYWANRS